MDDEAARIAFLPVRVEDDLTRHLSDVVGV